MRVSAGRAHLDGWTASRVLDLAPDSSSRKAGQPLGRAGAWLSLGRDETLARGEIKGGGAAPYRTALGLDGPIFRRTCPSRKLPRKHGLGLSVVPVQAEGEIAPVPGWVAEWAAKRGAGSTPAPKGAEPAAASAAKPVDEEAQERWRRGARSR